MVATSTAVASLVSLRTSERVLDDELSAHLAGIVAVAASVQRADVLAALRPGDEATLAYRNAAARLQSLRANAHLNDAFIVGRDARLLVGLGGEAQIGAERFLLHLDPRQIDRAWRGDHPIGTRYTARDGRPYRAAYAPIVDSAGQPVALLGVEASADYYAALRDLRLRSYAVGGFALFIAVVTAALLARSLLRPIKDLALVAESIGDDPVDRAVARKRSDEFGLLTDAFDRLRWRIAARDLELARRADAALARERQLGEQILAALSTGIVTLDASGAVTSHNPAALRILDASDGAEVARRLTATAGLSEVLRAERDAAAEVELHARGARRIVRAAASKFSDQPAGRLLVLDDVTDRRELERRFGARETLAKLGELSAGIAHEVRNPLNGIRLLLGLLSRDLANAPESRALVDRAEREIDSLGLIVSDFLQFARPLDLQVARIVIAELIDGVLLFAAAELERRHLTVRREVQPEALLFGDVEQLKRALLNLVLNAAQASPDGAELIVAAARRGDRVRLSVRDHGGGVHPDVRERLFTPFVTRRAGGTGLGLALVQKIASLHGGECVLEATGPEGSTFTLDLPVGAA